MLLGPPWLWAALVSSRLEGCKSPGWWWSAGATAQGQSPRTIPQLQSEIDTSIPNKKTTLISVCSCCRNWHCYYLKQNQVWTYRNAPCTRNPTISVSFGCKILCSPHSSLIRSVEVTANKLQTVPQLQIFTFSFWSSGLNVQVHS